MSVILAENFTDFGLTTNTRLPSVQANSAAIAKIIPSDVFPYTTDTGVSSALLCYQSKRDDGSAIDKHHADDNWLAFIRGTWNSNTTFRSFIRVPALEIFQKDGTWCLSIRASIGELTASKGEFPFGIWLGDGGVPIFRIDSTGTAYVGANAVGSALLAAKMMQVPMGIDILISSTGATAVASVYVNNAMLGAVNLTSAVNQTWLSFGYYVSTTSDTRSGTCMSFVRDVVVTFDDGSGLTGRCGQSFHVQKMLPVSDVETEWIGDQPHAALMARAYPTQEGEAFLTAYMFGQREEFNMQPIDATRGKIVADVSVEVEAHNTGTTAVPFECTFRGITGTIKTVNGNSDVPRAISLGGNPETGRDWDINDLASYTAGFGIEARK